MTSPEIFGDHRLFAVASLTPPVTAACCLLTTRRVHGAAQAEGAARFQWVSVGFGGFRWFQWVSVGFSGFQWVSVGFGGLWWVVVGVRSLVLVDVCLLKRKAEAGPCGLR